MTKKQMMALKPGDIVVEKTTGDEFVFDGVAKICDILPNGESFHFHNHRQELRVKLIPGFEYTKKYRGGYKYYFSHKRMAVKEATE